MASADSVNGYLLTHVAKVLRIVGKDPTPLFAESGLRETELLDPDARVPYDSARRFWEHADALSEDATFGLTVARHAREGLPTLRYAFKNSSTLGEAYRRWSRFYRLVSNAGEQTLLRDPDGARMRYDGHGPSPLPTVFEDWMVGQWLSVGRILVGSDWVPTRAVFQHGANPNADAYRRWFGAPVEFGADHTAIWFDAALLDRPIIGADPGLNEILDRHLRDVVARVPAGGSFAERVRAAMAARLDGGDPGTAAIARSLHTSERTLSRRLRAEGTSPRELLQQLRHELAVRYLRDPSISLTEVAFLLGYSEAAPFHRAFRRWTGQTPSAFRKATQRSGST